jgi:reactive chlorine resistance protein C
MPRKIRHPHPDKAVKVLIMTHSTTSQNFVKASNSASFVTPVTKAEHILLRYGLALILVWIGGMKFTSYEANGIRGLEANSPFLNPFLNLLGTQGLANIIGIVEITAALLLIVGPLWPRAGIVGSVIAVFTFLTTLTFLFTTPGWEPALGGFPALSGSVGQFLIKDIVLLGAPVYTARESLAALQHRLTN